MILGTILAFFLSNQSRSKAGLGIHHENSSQFLLKMTFVLLLDKRMLLLIPLLAYSGLEQAFVWAKFTKFVVKPAIGVAGVGGAMAIFGAADAIVSGPRLPHKKHGVKICCGTSFNIQNQPNTKFGGFFRSRKFGNDIDILLYVWSSNFLSKIDNMTVHSVDGLVP
ncbi:UNC93-like protein 3 [Cryptomeria japonica]|uniref:UNC93-like protein 3 n=1 Tax=Cryptomeria japonica TaxID=3369 RepID=UPI0027DA0964|nr:UNC93-like protein 3 [Cryptomeria japonica]